MKVILRIFILFSLTANSLVAQCDFTANLGPSGLILCPDSGDSLRLTGVEADSLKWFRWLGFDWAEVEELSAWENETSVYVNAFNDGGFNFFCQVWLDGCTENSDTVLVDGWMFLPVTVMNGGNADLNENGIWEIGCTDSAYLELLSPYTASITWYLNGTPIDGENNTILNIQTTGSYTVTAAPGVCPNSIGSLGLSIDYEVLPLPSVTVNLNDNLFTVLEGQSWQWQLNGEEITGANGASFEANTAGNYSVLVTFSDGCTVESEPIAFTPSLLDPFQQAYSWVGPNPANEYIRLNAETEQLVVSLFDMSGRLLKTANFTKETLFYVNEYPNGVYLLNLKKSNGEFTNIKLIIQKS